jgi:resuscitation-promoting factor RpfB
VIGAFANDDPQPSIPPSAASVAAPRTTTSLPSPTPTATPARTATATPTAKPSTSRVAASPSTRTTRTPAPSDPEPDDGGCHANYSGACVPIAKDVDCAGGSGNGPAYVRGPLRVVGKDVYDLDRDGDGTACDR